MGDDTRDVIARAIAGDGIDYSQYQRAKVLRQVNTIIAAIAAKGLVILPREATDAMCEEGANAYHDAVEEKWASKTALYQRIGKQMPPSAEKVCPDDWLAPVYRAMLAAYGGSYLDRGAS